MAILQSYRDKFRPIYDYFNDFIEDISFFNFDNINYTDNMKEDVFLFCMPKISEETDNAAVTILPNDFIEDIVVIIDISNNNNVMYAESLIHELIHVIDYNNFAKHFLNGDLNLINSHILKEDYKSWSEFRAFSTAQIKCYEYMDLACHRSYTSIIMKQYELNLEDFLIRQRLALKTGQFSDYELSKVFGSIYLLDNYHNIKDFSKSHIYNYLPILFKSDLIYQMYDLYFLYFDSDRNHTIFENLYQIQDLQSKVFQSQ